MKYLILLVMLAACGAGAKEIHEPDQEPSQIPPAMDAAYFGEPLDPMMEENPDLETE